MTMVDATNPWAVQKTLMQASNQTLPDAPVLHKGLILYAALNLEEGRETLAGLVKALQRTLSQPGLDTKVANKLLVVASHLHEADVQMHEHSLAVRSAISDLSDDFRAPLERAEIREMTDGTMDLTVTNSGFALSLGIDGVACYGRVATSNLSKRNPDTGVIDKTPDGKWIKGRNFVEPDLDSVLFPGE
jgi:hypothetical protein